MTISKSVAKITICTFKPSQYHKNNNKIKEFCYIECFDILTSLNPLATNPALADCASFNVSNQ